MALSADKTGHIMSRDTILDLVCGRQKLPVGLEHVRHTVTFYFGQIALETSAERTREKDQRKHPEVTVACREKAAAAHTERREGETERERVMS